MSKTDTFENEVLRISTGQSTSVVTTTPITPWVALFTGAPSDSGGGTEVSGGSYARVNSSGLWGTPSGGSVSNSSDINFPSATANWGTVTHFAIFTASSGGTMLRWGALTSSVAVNNGDQARFTSGSITLTED